MTLAVGDIFAIIDKSWALYKILSDSRSSNTQYRDLKNQLSNLYAVLLGVKQAQKSGSLGAFPENETSVSDEPEDAYSLIQCIARIVQNCGETLDQLYEIFDKYRILGVGVGSNSASLAKIKHVFQKTEKKIRFTTEKEDLDSLRLQVQLHTNNLGVLLDLVNISQGSRIESITSKIASQTTTIETQTGEVNKLLKEIYTGWRQSLQSSHGNSKAAREASRPEGTDTLFSIFEEDTPSSSQAICYHARLYSAQESGEGGASSRRLFRCCCDELEGRSSSSHRHVIEAYALLDDTFSVRLAGNKREWVMHNVSETSTNLKVALRLADIKPNYMAIFEDSMADLAAQAIPVMLQPGRDSNYFVYEPSDSKQSYVLGIYSDLSDLVPKVEGATLISRGGASLPTKNPVSALQLLQYDEFSTPEANLDKRLGESADIITHDSSGTSALPPAELLVRRPQGDFEINIRCTPESAVPEGSEQIAEMNLIFDKDTNIVTPQKGSRNSSVTVERVHVEVCSESGEQIPFDQADVQVQFSSVEAARSFHERVEDMRTELKVLDLVQPRREETTRLHVSAVKIDCDEFNIPDADFSVLRDPKGRYRLIVASRNRCTIISQELVPDFFNQAKQTGKMNFASLAYVVQIDNKGVRTLTRREQGLRHLRFERGRDGTNMLEIACNTLLLGN